MLVDRTARSTKTHPLGLAHHTEADEFKEANVCLPRSSAFAFSELAILSEYLEKKKQKTVVFMCLLYQKL